MRKILAVVVLSAALAAGCEPGTTPVEPITPLKSLPAVDTSTTEAPSTPTTTPPPSSTVPAVTPVTKVLVFIEENHSLDQMKSGMPYAYSLAETYGYSTNFTATRHPSLPNYLAIAGGQTFGVTDDQNPSGHRIHGPSVFGQAIAAGKTAGVFADGMGSNCSTSKGGDAYVPRHNPWTYFVDERSLCQKFDVPVDQLNAAIEQGSLPTVGMVVPNLDNDAHDGSLGTADKWFKAWMDKITAGPDWKSGSLAVVLTADEDDHNQGNKVLTIVINPRVHHQVIETAFTQYSLTRLYGEIAGTSLLGNAKTAESMLKAFGLD